MFWAIFRPILVKKLFKVFAISNVFVISMTFIFPLSSVGRGSLVLFLDKMPFNVLRSKRSTWSCRADNLFYYICLAGIVIEPVIPPPPRYLSIAACLASLTHCNIQQ